MTACDVILPVHNAAATLEVAVGSLLGQTHRDLRIIAIDDGSTDASLEILRGIRDDRMLLVVNEENLGLPATLNRGVALAEAPFIARMDADDVAHPSRLEKQVQALLARPDLDLLGTAVVCIDSQGRLLGQRTFPATHPEIVTRPYRSIPLAHPTWCGRREWFVGHPYDPSDLKAQDQSLLRRAMDGSCYGNLTEPLLAYRESTSSRPGSTLRSRGYIARDMIRTGRSRGELISGITGAAGVLSRWSLDVLVWITGDPRAAFHRFEPLAEGHRLEWESILGKSRCCGQRG